MIKTVNYLLAVLLATSAWTIKAEATGKGNPTGGKFAVEHPRRNEVNTRIDNQRERINQGVKNGTLTQQQAQQLRANDRAIKRQEHAELIDSSGNGLSVDVNQLGDFFLVQRKSLRMTERNGASNQGRLGIVRAGRIYDDLHEVYHQPHRGAALNGDGDRMLHCSSPLPNSTREFFENSWALMLMQINRVFENT